MADLIAPPRLVQNDDDVDLTALSKAAKYCNKELEGLFAAFFDEHGKSFEQDEGKDEVVASGQGEADEDFAEQPVAEHSLEHTVLHRKYCEQFEGVLEGFLVEHGCDHTQFVAECEAALDGRFAPLFEEDVNKWFVDVILATTDYSIFHRMMQDEWRRRRDERVSKVQEHGESLEERTGK